MCYQPILVGKDSYPCGKCYECSKRKQLDYTQLMMRQVEVKGSLHFVTFTYNDLNIPIRCLDMSSGELGFLHDLSCFKDLGENERNIIRECYIQRVKDRKEPYGRFHHEIISLSFGTFNCVYSLCRLDFRLWLKRARVNYERKFGKKLSDFTYFCFGEYGEKSWRPHYHANFYGLKDEEVNYIINDWKNRFGYVLSKSVPSFSSSEVARVSMYIGKYVSKGVADCEELLLDSSMMEKPRPLSSCGMSVRQGLLSILTLDGKLNPYDRVFAVEDIKRVVSRMRYSVGSSDFFLGSHFFKTALRVPNTTYRNRVDSDVFSENEYQTSFYISEKTDEYYYVKEKPHSISSCLYKASPLQLAISDYIRGLALQANSEHNWSVLHSFKSTEEIYSHYGQFSDYVEYLQKSHIQDLQRSRQSQVSKSVF